MKQRTLWTRGLAVNSMILVMASAFQVKSEPAAPKGASNLGPVPSEQTAESAVESETPPADTDAPAKVISEAKSLPANIRPTGPVAEVIKLADSGLGEPVMLAFVTNSARTFNLGADDIIYLNDIGVPGSVVTAMIQRDDVLKTSLAAAATPATQPEPGASEPTLPEGAPMAAATPGPDQIGPEPAEAGPGYAVEAPLTPPEDSGAMFYDSLAPYGNWVDVEGYGRCWQPTAVVVNAGWQPYFDCGHWVYSDCGWYWLSNYSWGWAPFHYGSWFRHARMGWCWVPGRVWGPSWVSWRYNDHFCGWAPLPPGASFAGGAGLTFRGHHVRDGDDLGLRPGHYRFIAWDHFNDHELRSRGVPWNRSERIFDETTVATRITGDNHTVINNGLPVSRVAAATHRPINTVALRERREPVITSGRAEHFEGGGHTLTVFRPTPELASRVPARQSTGATLGGFRSPGRQPPAPSAPSAPRSSSARRSSVDLRQDGRQGAPLVIRGAQSAAVRETPPANSLVVIGKRDPITPPIPAQPWSPASGSRPEPRSIDNQRPAGPAREQLAVSERSANRPVATPTTPRTWTGTVSSSPQPSWFAGSESRNRFSSAVPAPQPETRTYQPATRAASPEVPRYAPSQTYAPQRSYSAPAASASVRSPSFESRSAPAARSAAPAASAPSRSSPSGSSNRNQR